MTNGYGRRDDRVGFDLKERMARERARKDQRIAQRMSVKTMDTGEQLAAALAQGRQINETDLLALIDVVRTFLEGGDKLERVISLMKRSQRVMYEVAKKELQGEWMSAFLRLIESLPDDLRASPYTITWPHWRELGMVAGMREDEVVNALKVMMVMRDRKGASQKKRRFP